ncbi:hypothetical protein [Thermaurantimonas aggregans]|uniref:hypothetical protein n=1 Tax=Thermaurantimonas aggregans TaxID=2173829 RepID=UPI0023F17FE0|nr:hypothetical protein [Thermaurantimonas aggregans]MCX8148887.1 hypothetical protein [Thermaurantimonas aggregans]
MITFLFIFSTISSCFNPIRSQSLHEAETILADLGSKILKAVEYQARKQASDEFYVLLNDLLSQPESFNYPFEQVKNLSRLQSGDKFVNVFTWLLPLAEPNMYEFYGILQVKDKKNRIYLYTLVDKASEIAQPEYTALQPARWYGALYYQIIDVKHGNQTYYTLLGYRPQGKATQRKIVDALVIKSPKNIQFGAQIFYIQDLADRRYLKKPFRLFYDYSANVSATLRYNEKEKMIIMDHLAPPDASKKGVYAVYGPDFSYDGLYWNKGHWHLKEQIKFDTGIKDEIPTVPPPVRRKF